MHARRAADRRTRVCTLRGEKVPRSRTLGDRADEQILHQAGTWELAKGCMSRPRGHLRALRMLWLSHVGVHGPRQTIASDGAVSHAPLVLASPPSHPPRAACVAVLRWCHWLRVALLLSCVRRTHWRLQKECTKLGGVARTAPSQSQAGNTCTFE